VGARGAGTFLQIRILELLVVGLRFGWARVVVPAISNFICLWRSEEGLTGVLL
jgi:hypothetical protein